MKFDDFTSEEIRNIFNNTDNFFKTKKIEWIRYADLGCKVVRIVSYSKEFLPLVEKQLTYVLKEKYVHYDTTLVIWQSDNVFDFCKELSPKFNPKTNLKLRLEMITTSAKESDIQLIDNDFSLMKPVLWYNIRKHTFSAYDTEKNTYYYVVKDLNPEEFIKEGHIFVQFFNEALKDEISNLVHGAAIGLNGKGILFCARGQRGKSTLSVLSMMKGFEYVSDDYLTIHIDDNEQLLASPIYSIITLSPEMYNRLYDYMDGSRFISNNARKDKYVFNISNYHPQFRKNYPVKLAIFPEIVIDKDPSIRLCTPEEKGRAITHLIQSTLMQTKDLCEKQTIQKIHNMVKNLPFYKFNLCHDIDRNTEFLRDFMNNFESQDKTVIQTNRYFVDITFDLANILDSQEGIIYSMNKFATNIYQNLLNGVSLSDIENELKPFSEYNTDLIKQLITLVKILKEKGLYKELHISSPTVNLDKELMRINNYKLSLREFSNTTGCVELLRIEENDKNVKLQIK